MMRPLLLAASCLSLTLLASLGATIGVVDAEESEPISYLDVPVHHQHAEAILALSQQGVVQGYDNGRFGVDDNVNRAEALKMILESSSIELDSASTEADAASAEDRFPDVLENQWYLPYIEAGLETGIVSGHDDGYFRPGSPVNRAEALKMILESAGYNPLTHEDQAWYEGYLEIGEKNGLVYEQANQDYDLNANLSRGELADMIYRQETQKFTGQTEYGVASYYADKFNGRSTASGEVFSNSDFTAAHPSLPFGTMLRVTNLDSNLSVNVRVNDRGPYSPGRVIDLSKVAFDQIAHLGSGLLNARVEVLQ